jgi:hypothetical protein
LLSVEDDIAVQIDDFEGGDTWRAMAKQASKDWKDWGPGN